MSDPKVTETQPFYGKVVSHIPGRMRVRLRRDCRDPERMHRLKAALSASDGITEVETNPVSGSVLIQYDARKHAKENATDVVERANLVLSDAAPTAAPESASEYSDIAAALIRIADAVDGWLLKITGRRIDLRVLVPVGLAATGIAVAVARGGLGFADIPAYVILWIAIDAFIQLHRSNDRILEVPAAGQPSAGLDSGEEVCLQAAR